MSCLFEHSGTLADLYYDPPGDDKLSPGFRIPGWAIIAKRIKTTSESLVDGSESNQEGFDLSLFTFAV